ncbi:MAG: hypothetical protein L0Y64_14350, partial [Myxococcaceae bacterium]|nr:hypothetical protein [Myxococcaceae bacterium]
SGDKAPGLGNRPGRTPRTDVAGLPSREGSVVGTIRGDIDGPQFNCTATGCGDRDIRNFRFDRDYRIDMILWRDLLGAVTDAVYARPSITYQVAPGLELFGAAIYSRTLYPQSAPAFALNPDGSVLNNDPNLGVELNAGATYETEDGFLANLRYGILFPLGGLRSFGQTPGVEQGSAQSIRAMLGIRF